MPRKLRAPIAVSPMRERGAGERGVRQRNPVGDHRVLADHAQVGRDVGERGAEVRARLARPRHAVPDPAQVAHDVGAVTEEVDEERRVRGARDEPQHPVADAVEPVDLSRCGDLVGAVPTLAALWPSEQLHGIRLLRTDRPASTRSRRPERLALQEQPRLGVDERGGAAVADRDALRLPGGARREDDPRVVLQAGQARTDALRGRRRQRDGALGADDGADPRLAEHQVGALVGVVRVDGDVSRADRQRREDRDVQVGGARRDADPDPVAVADPGGTEHGAEGVDLAQQRGVVEHPVAVVDRRGTGVGAGGRLEDVAQGPLRRRGARDVHRRHGGARVAGRGRHVWHAHRRRVEEGGIKPGHRGGGRLCRDGRDLLGHTVARRIHRDDRDPGGRGVGRGCLGGGRDERDPGGRGVDGGLLRRLRDDCDDRNPGGRGVDRDRSRRPGRGDNGDR